MIFSMKLKIFFAMILALRCALPAGLCLAESPKEPLDLPDPVDLQEPENISVDIAPFRLKELKVADFSGRPAWIAEPVDGKMPAKVSLSFRKADKATVLGVKIRFLDTDEFIFRIRPKTPVRLGKGLKTIDAEIYGNATPYRIACAFADREKRDILEIDLDRLNYFGWKKVRAALPPDLERKELFFDGFRLYVAPVDVAGGTVYLYFGKISAMTGEEVNR
jgi:hypothetical protein